MIRLRWLVFRLILVLPLLTVAFLWIESHRRYAAFHRELVTDTSTGFPPTVNGSPFDMPRRVSLSKVSVRQTTLASDQGIIRLEHSESLGYLRYDSPYNYPLLHPDWRLRRYPVRPYIQNPDLPWYGFVWQRSASPTDSVTTVAAGYPHLLALAMAPLICAGLAPLRRWLRRRRNRCPVCNYDLRFSTVRCPECGTART